MFIEGTLIAPDRIETKLGTYKGNRAYDWGVGTSIEMLLRPDDVVPDPGSNLRVEIVQKAFKGAEIMYTLQLPEGGRLLSLFPSHADHRVGESVGIRIEADHLVAFPKGSRTPNLQVHVNNT